jgi:hypothetical protein
MAMIDKNGNPLEPGLMAVWIQSLPEPKKSEYEALRQAGVAAGHNTEGFARIFREFCDTNGITDTDAPPPPDAE